MQIAERKQPFNLCKGAVKCTIAALLGVVSWAAMGRTLSFEANPSLSSPRKHKNNTQNIASYYLSNLQFLKSK